MSASNGTWIRWIGRISAPKIWCGAATKAVNPGDIVLFHNDSKYILQALPQILEYYQQAGYRIIPISELLLEGDTWIDHAGTQHLATPAPSAAEKETDIESKKIE